MYFKVAFFVLAIGIVCTDSCSWPGHCAGAACSTHDDCSDDLTCANKVCGGGGAAATTARPSSTCAISGYLTGTPGTCNQAHMAHCCIQGTKYPQYRCSPPVSTTQNTTAILTLNSFELGGDGGGAGACTGKYYSNSIRVVALSTG